jgi:hypothetical protein
MEIACCFVSILLTLLSPALAGSDRQALVQSVWVSATGCTLYYSEIGNHTVRFDGCSSPSFRNSSWSACIGYCCS